MKKQFIITTNDLGLNLVRKLIDNYGDINVLGIPIKRGLSSSDVFVSGQGDEIRIWFRCRERKINECRRMLNRLEYAKLITIEEN